VGCSGNTTAILLHVNAGAGFDFQSVEVRVVRDGDVTAAFDQTFTIGAGGFALPGSVGINARDPNDTRAVLIHVEGTLVSGGTIDQDLSVHFERGRTIDVNAMLGSACGPDAGATDFSADFDTTGYAPFERLAGSNPSCLAIVTDPVRDGPSAAQFTVMPGDTLGGTREGCVLFWDSSNEQEGTDAYYGWSLYLPPDWTTPSEGVRLAGWSGVAVGPTVGLAMGTDGYFEIENNGGSADEVAMTVERSYTDHINAPGEPGHWYDFVFHVLFEGNRTDGRVTVWYRRDDLSSYVQVFDDSGLFTLQRGISAVETTAFFVGIDRAASGETRSVAFDHVRRGTSFAAVALGACAQP
jgi:hypothetical protein